jgi:DNA-binding response OmpR family regulator
MAQVLVIEDEAPLRRIITLNLARRGYTVAEADSVATADEALAATVEPFDAILLDVNLPDKTGWDVLRYLPPATADRGAAQGAAPRRPHVIVIAAVRPVQARLDEFHPDAVLVKPFPIDVLARLLERVLADGRPATEAAGEDPVPDVQQA